MQVTITKKDSFKSWIEKTNLISENIGDLDDLNTTNKSNIVNPINETLGTLQGELQNVVEDTNPALGGHLDLNSFKITGNGNISIIGTMDVTSIVGSTLGFTQLLTDESDKIATTAYTGAKVSAVAPSVTFSGDISGAPLSNQIEPNVVGLTELDTTFFDSGGLLFVSTQGNGQLKFINTDSVGAIGGGDISGSIDYLEINQGVINVAELDLADSSVGHIATTDGVGVINFRPSVIIDTLTPNIGDHTFLVNYNIGKIVVYMNGIKLVNGVDFTATNGTQVVLTPAVSTNNTTLEFQRYCV